jgi:aspartyl aminopeptidase
MGEREPVGGRTFYAHIGSQHEPAAQYSASDDRAERKTQAWTDAISDASLTPYHAVAEVAKAHECRLLELFEWDECSCARRCRYVVRCGGTVLVALALGEAPPSRAGFRLAAAHTDSPNLRLKPRSESRAYGHRQLAIEIYGSPLLHTWLDRDLSLAGRVSLIDGTTHLVRFDRPICRISSLAIHLSPPSPPTGFD